VQSLSCTSEEERWFVLLYDIRVGGVWFIERVVGEYGWGLCYV